MGHTVHKGQAAPAPVSPSNTLAQTQQCYTQCWLPRLLSCLLLQQTGTTARSKYPALTRTTLDDHHPFHTDRS